MTSFPSRSVSLAFAASALALSVFGTSVAAQEAIDTQSSAVVNKVSRMSNGYWTSERMRNAVPMDKRAPSAQVGSAKSMTGTSVASQGQAPATEPVAAPSRRLDLPVIRDVGSRSAGGSANAYTTSMVFPDSHANVYPYRTAGKIFFTDGGLNYSCSGSIVNRRILITAAHCLYNTAVNRWHSNIVFVPSYNANLATQPFGSWNWASMRVPTGWINGCECFPSAYDFGSIEVADRLIGASTWRIGDYLGWLGWQTFALAGNNVTQLGYPGNLDSSRRMMQNNSQAAADSAVSARIGTAMQKGSSGGPWIQDFGVAAPGQLITSSGPNRVLGVTSYGVVGAQYAGATVLNDTWVNVYNAACANRAGNC